MPQVIIIAGPNGAGKTTFATEYISGRENFEFVNADEIARSLIGRDLSQQRTDLRAAQTMLARIEALANKRPRNLIVVAVWHSIYILYDFFAMRTHRITPKAPIAILHHRLRIKSGGRLGDEAIQLEAEDWIALFRSQ